MTRVEYAELALKALTALAALIGGCAAWRGVNTWRKQLIGQDEYSLAKKLIKSGIELEHSIRRLRNPGNLPELTWPAFEEIAREMDVYFLEAEVHWGELLSDVKNSIVQCTNSLRLQSERLATLSEHESSVSAEIRREANSILWARIAGPDDEFAQRLHLAIVSLSEKMRPYLKK